MGAAPAAEVAPAKVNLFLHVTGRRPDGYHELDSLVVFAGLGDVLRAGPADGLTLALEGPFAAGLENEADNLVMRAARALAKAHAREPRVGLRLQKNLPLASGIGGGSADAAACLRLLGRLWGVTPSVALAAALGADVPVCLASRPARVGGIGERLSPAPRLPACGLALVNPGQALPTQAVFRARQGPFSGTTCMPAGWPDAAAMARTLALLGNDLEAAAITICPEIADVLGALRATAGCLLARMSGSGATCFGLFAEPDAAIAAAGLLARERWWSWGGAMRTA